MTVTFHSEARKELFKAAEFYEDQVVGLGEEFIDEIEKVIELIQIFPTSGSKITKSERRFLISRFPYAAIYTLESDDIIIFAVMDDANRIIGDLALQTMDNNR